MNKIDLEIGQTILLELEDECLLGKVSHVASDQSFIRLSDVRDTSTKKNYGVQTYYNSEIRNIQVASTDSRTTLQSSSPSDSGVVKSKQLTLDNLNSTLEQINNYVFIHQTDAKYHDTIRFLKKQHHFGIAMECIEHGRHSKSSSLLTIATLDSIYIFDIKWMNITNELRELLVSDRYRRVLYNGRLIGDTLRHKFGVPLGKCFDVMVAHIAISKNAGRVVDDTVSLQQCVQSYLNLPDKFFNTTIDFNVRPLNDAAKRESGKNAVFLLPLQDLFIHEIMLEPFYKSCISYTQSLSNNPDFINSLADLRNKGPEAIEAIQPSKLGIDVELINVTECEQSIE
ncbi:uncharacterized protein LOC126560713 [Anopheles maculipalpis]|uniref:uncharacterized protein LOC126560713 n=1 Tax=Anopheles maculipalpis TaxID=1496333 RepID=UPI002159AEBD|nr:uncharacterized protein LOC126560713 [Anopheles maculipalpis]